MKRDLSKTKKELWDYLENVEEALFKSVNPTRKPSDLIRELVEDRKRGFEYILEKQSKEIRERRIELIGMVCVAAIITFLVIMAFFG